MLPCDVGELLQSKRPSPFSCVGNYRKHIGACNLISNIITSTRCGVNGNTDGLTPRTKRVTSAIVAVYLFLLLEENEVSSQFNVADCCFASVMPVSCPSGASADGPSRLCIISGLKACNLQCLGFINCSEGTEPRSLFTFNNFVTSLFL